MTLQLGTTIDGYEFIDVLDSSSRRVVYRVRNLRTGEFEQLQVLSEVLEQDPVRSERFLREIRILANLSHPNIIACHGAVQLDGHWAMTMEMLEGVTLAERLELGPLPLPEAVEVMRQLLSAVSCAHRSGIIHREITPGNILITPDQVIKLTGFTFAKSSSDLDLTQVGTIIGDAEYISPEQVRGVEKLDPRSDLYSLGAVFYTVLTGKPPFEAASQYDLLMAHVEKEPAPPGRLRPGIPPALDSVVLKALAKQPEDRHQSAEEFLGEIEAVALDVAAPEPPAPIERQPVRVAPLRADMPEAIPPWLYLAVTLCVVCLLLAALSWVSQQGRG